MDIIHPVDGTAVCACDGVVVEVAAAGGVVAEVAAGDVVAVVGATGIVCCVDSTGAVVCGVICVFESLLLLLLALVTSVFVIVVVTEFDGSVGNVSVVVFVGIDDGKTVVVDSVVGVDDVGSVDKVEVGVDGTVTVVKLPFMIDIIHAVDGGFAVVDPASVCGGCVSVLISSPFMVDANLGRCCFFILPLALFSFFLFFFVFSLFLSIYFAN